MNATSRNIGIRSALFLALLAMSVPLAYPVLSWVFSLLPQSEHSQSRGWHLVDDLVFDMPVKWGFVVTAPVALVLRGALLVLPMGQTILFSCLAWVPVAAGYGWLTRRVRLPFVIAGVYPTIWAVGIAVGMFVGAVFGYANDTSL